MLAPFGIRATRHLGRQRRVYAGDQVVLCLCHLADPVELEDHSRWTVARLHCHIVWLLACRPSWTLTSKAAS